ncbi:MAG: rod shape-determining protein MreD [Phycisphaerales bacterium]|nr:rod shape-determining protein MreD [Phycisphaerales bacterium]
MRWLVFIIAALIAVGLDSGFSGIFTLRGAGFLTPSFAACLLAFVALLAPPVSVIWAAWFLGLLADLSPGLGEAGGGIQLIGPHALGYPLGAWVVLNFRTWMFRRRVLTISLLTFLCVLVAGLVQTAIGILRFWLPWAGGELVPFGAGEMLHETGNAAYSALLAIPLGWILIQTLPLWRFDYGTSRRSG